MRGGVHREGIYGNARKGHGERERGRKGDNENGNVEAVGEECDVMVRVLQDHEKEMSQRKTEHTGCSQDHSTFRGVIFILTQNLL